MSLAKEFRVAITRREVAFNQDLKAFACKPDIDPEFLFYALFARREPIRELAREASHGNKKARNGYPCYDSFQTLEVGQQIANFGLVQRVQ